MLKPVIVAHQFGAYSETFIKAHVECLSDRPVLLAIGPRSNEIFFNGKIIKQNNTFIQLQFIFSKILKLTKLDYRKYYFLKVLQKFNVNVIIAEYGNLGIYMKPISDILGIPLIVFFRGYDIYKNDPISIQQKEYKALFNSSKRIIAVSKDIQDKLIEKGCPSDKIEWLPSGADSSFLDVNPSFENDCFISLGRFVNKKAPYFLIFAFNKISKKFPNASMIIGGNGELLQSCVELSKFLGLEDKIQFPGSISKELFCQLLSTSLCYVQHSIIAADGDSEGTPNSILEASLAGLPVISTRHGGIPDVVIHGETGFLVDEKDYETMSKYMIKFLENKLLAKQLGSQGRDLIKARFLRNHQLKRIKEIMEE